MGTCLFRNSLGSELAVLEAFLYRLLVDVVSSLGNLGPELGHAPGGLAHVVDIPLHRIIEVDVWYLSKVCIRYIKTFYQDSGGLFTCSKSGAFGG